MWFDPVTERMHKVECAVVHRHRERMIERKSDVAGALQCGSCIRQAASASRQKKPKAPPRAILRSRVLDADFAAETDVQIARNVGCSREYVRQIRKQIGAPPSPRLWDPSAADLGARPDTEIAAELGVTGRTVRRARIKFGIPAHRSANRQVSVNIVRASWRQLQTCRGPGGASAALRRAVVAAMNRADDLRPFNAHQRGLDLVVRTVALDDECLSWLDMMAERTGTSRSAVLRAVLR